MAKLPQVKCKDWDDLARQLDSLGKLWVYRGHCSVNWTLQSTLERRNPPGDKALYTEYNAILEFTRRAHQYLASEHIPKTQGESLAMMQHFGAPTRLLDFTRSPFVAAYFAFEESPTDCEESAVVAINRGWLHSHLGAKALASGLFGFPVEAIQVGATKMNEGDGPKIPDSFAAGELMAGQVEKHASETTGDYLALFEPIRLSERLSIQQGLFLWPGRVDRTVMDLLGDLGDMTDGVLQYCVQSSERGRALEQLRLMNITRASLFPGLDGFARSLRYLAVREPVQSRTLRMAMRGLEQAVVPRREE